MSSRRFKWTAAWLLFGLCACASTSRPIDHEILVRGSHAGSAGPGARFEVIETPSGLAALYDKLFAGRLPPPPVPDVDFSRFLVLSVVMDQQSTAGYRVELGPPVLRGDAVTVRVVFHEPSGEDPLAAVLTRPFAVMQVVRPAGAKTVRFVDRAGNRLESISLR